MFAVVESFNKKGRNHKNRGQAGSLDYPDSRPARAVGLLYLLLDEESAVKSAVTTSTCIELPLAHKPKPVVGRVNLFP